MSRVAPTQKHIDGVVRTVAERQLDTGNHVSRKFVHARLGEFDPELVDAALESACRDGLLRSHGFPPTDVFQICPLGIERCGPAAGRISGFVEGVLRFYKVKRRDDPDFPGFSWLELARFLGLDHVKDYNFGIAALNIAEIAGAGYGSPAIHEATYEVPRELLAFLRCAEFGEYLELFRQRGVRDAGGVRPEATSDTGDTRPREVERLRFLAVGTEWDSAKGGLSTLNRRLCIALAAAGHEVVCAVHTASENERLRASQRGVTLAPQPARSSPIGAAQFRKPQVPTGFRPDYIIGHGRVTGSEAFMLAEDHFEGSRRLHFIHMAPDEIEWHKGEREDDAADRADQRTLAEVELSRTAHRAVAIGPRLQARFSTELEASGLPLPMRLDPGFDAGLTGARSPPSGRPLRVLVLGRAEDARLKGLDIAARAAGLAAEELDSEELELVVRGAPEGTGEELRASLITWAESSRLHVVVRPYTSDSAKIDADIAGASVVLMPSRTEGFGLVGLEAIAAGAPALVSRESGLGLSLLEELGDAVEGRTVVPVSDDRAAAAEAWARALVSILRDRGAAFAWASELRGLLAETKSWERAVKDLVAGIAGESASRADSTTGSPSASTKVAPPLDSDPRRGQDLKMLHELLGHVSVRMISDHIDEARQGRIHTVFFHVADWFEEYRRGPMFHVYDPDLRSQVEEFHDALVATLSQPGWFYETKNPSVYKFSKENEFPSYQKWQEAWSDYMRSVERSYTALRAFLDHVRAHYPEVDVAARDAAAQEWVRRLRERIARELRLDG